MGTGCGDPEIQGPKWLGTICPRGPNLLGVNFMGIVCPGGQEVGDQKSGDQMGSGPNASQPCLPILKIISFPKGQEM